jgi:signal transduction histidine kinase
VTSSLPIDRLRHRLTAWYLLTLCGIVVLLGGGLFLAIQRQFQSQLTTSLRNAATELERAAQRSEQEAGSAAEGFDAIGQLHVPDRTLYLLDATGIPVRPTAAEPWIREAARRAAASGTSDEERELPEDRTLRLHAERFTLRGGKVMIAVAVADKVELEDRYAALITTFAAAALVALVLVSAGAWWLVRQSTAPVERSMEQMRRFMADAAHELRTPLTVLRAQAEVALEQSREAPEYVASLKAIDAESQRLARIVDDLLTLARADAGERPIERRRVFLDDIAMDAAQAARAIAAAKGVTLTINDFEEAAIEGDPELLRRLIVILLDNAVKFTPTAGNVRIGVSRSNTTATLVVGDTGIGIPAEQLPHVFERFYRGDPARVREKAEATGAGLGLAIAQWITEAHQATLAIDSLPGRGTTVTVRFPVGSEQHKSLSSP